MPGAQDRPGAEGRSRAAEATARRAAPPIVNGLERGCYLAHERVGRRNRYRVNSDLPFRHALEENHTIVDLLETLEA